VRRCLRCIKIINPRAYKGVEETRTFKLIAALPLTFSLGIQLQESLLLQQGTKSCRAFLGRRLMGRRGRQRVKWPRNGGK
jgi:hypothetical protein